MEKSTIGMYRSLLVQLFEKIPELLSVFDSPDLPVASFKAGFHWNVELLKRLFEEAIGKLGESSVVCYIDALDECNEVEIRDMIQFF